MKIFPKKRILYPNLFFGVLWLSYGVYRFISGNGSQWLSYGFIIISIVYLIQFFYFFIKPVLVIENNQIIWNDLFRSKTFGLDEVVRIKKFAGDVTIFTKTDKIALNTQVFDKESAAYLNSFLDKLDLNN